MVRQADHDCRAQERQDEEGVEGDREPHVRVGVSRAQWVPMGAGFPASAVLIVSSVRFPVRSTRFHR